MARISCGTPLYPQNCGSSVDNTPCATPTIPATLSCEPIPNPCQENHCLEIITTEYGPDLQTDSVLTIPSCQNTAAVAIKGLVSAMVGSFIWSPFYGYYEIVSFVPDTRTLIVKNHCTVGNAAAGTQVPLCSLFVVTGPPCNLANSDVPYLTSDFVVPIVSGCTAVSVTDTTNLSNGDTIVIGPYAYLLSTVVNSTSILICNQGDGGPPGTTVSALNASGNYQYPIIIINSSSTLQAQNAVTGTLSSGSPAIGAGTSITFTNPSSTKTAQIFYTLSAIAQGNVNNAHSSFMGYHLSIINAVDANPSVTEVLAPNSKYTASDAATPHTFQITWDGIDSIPPGATKTITLTAQLDWAGTGAANFVLGALTAEISALVVL